MSLWLELALTISDIAKIYHVLVLHMRNDRIITAASLIAQETCIYANPQLWEERERASSTWGELLHASLYFIVKISAVFITIFIIFMRNTNLAQQNYSSDTHVPISVKAAILVNAYLYLASFIRIYQENYTIVLLRCGRVESKSVLARVT